MANFLYLMHRTVPLKKVFSILVFTIINMAFASSLSSPLARMYGDPHFEGFDGIHFDFTGTPGSSYCLLADPRIHVNMEMVGFEVNRNGNGNGSGNRMRTWVKALGFLSGGHSIEMRARKGLNLFKEGGFTESILVDGIKVDLSRGKTTRTEDLEISLQFLSDSGKEGEEEMDRYELCTKGGFQILIVIRPENAEIRGIVGDDVAHFAVEVVNAAPLMEPHGVLGQSFRTEQKLKVFQFRTVWSSETNFWQVAGPNGEGYLEGKVEDYLSSSLLKADCKFSKYRNSFASEVGIIEFGSEESESGNTVEEDKFISSVYAEILAKETKTSEPMDDFEKISFDMKKLEADIRKAEKSLSGEKSETISERIEVFSQKEGESKKEFDSGWLIKRLSERVGKNGLKNLRDESESLGDPFFEETAVRVIKARPRKILPAV